MFVLNAKQTFDCGSSWLMEQVVADKYPECKAVAVAELIKKICDDETYVDEFLAEVAEHLDRTVPVLNQLALALRLDRTLDRDDRLGEHVRLVFKVAEPFKDQRVDYEWILRRFLEAGGTIEPASPVAP